MQKIKLNCDLGESFGVYRLCDESQIIPLVDQANIACGFHAGDPLSIMTSLALCAKHDVSVGAHPAYPDLQGFGRRSMQLSCAELEACLLYQLAVIKGLANLQGITLDYVKPHGALYNDMMKSNDIFRTVVRTVAKFDSSLALMILATPAHIEYTAVAQQYGVSIILEAFADRRYSEDGKLFPRTQTNAVLAEPDALQQARAFINGSAAFPVHSLCVHGDSTDALAMVRNIKALL